MAPTKRSRPSFSPPRPRKTTNTSNTKSTSGTSAASKSKAQSKAKATVSGGTSKGKTKARSKPTESASRRRSKLVSPTPSASDSQGDSDNEEDDSMIVDENDNSDDEDDNNDNSRITNQPSESPEPDYILAEVTHESTSSDEPPIPLGLVHRILHAHFSNPEKTKISTDAKEVVGRYIEVFVREAIMRCAYEKNGEAPDANGRNRGTAQSDGGGWLELEDLEKVAVQLCLDF